MKAGIYYTLILVLAILATSCVQDPSSPGNEAPGGAITGAYVLCEGVYGYDNSTVTRVDLASGAATQNFFSLVNPGLRIGDTGNDMIIQGDTVLVVVSTSKSVEAFSASTGKWIGRLTLEGDRFPRSICRTDAGTAYLTDAYDNSVIKIDTRMLRVLNSGIAVGAQPEGIDYCGGRLFVANSGWGDINQNGVKAGYLSVIDTRTDMETATIYCGPNLTEIVADRQRGVVYACFYNLPSLKDSLGGIVEYDAATLAEKRRWRLKASDLLLTATGDTLLFINDNFSKSNGRSESGLSMIDIRTGDVRSLLKNPNPDDIWYGFARRPGTEEIWICNARNNRTEGEIDIYRLNSPCVFLRSCKTGINPSKVRFY